VSDLYGTVEVTSRAEWRAWLAAHHASSPGVWLVTYKKAAGARYLPYADQVEEALCFGWVDSKARGLDAHRSQLLMTPRTPRSGWSRPNKERVARLAAAGLMAPAGLAAVRTAKANGAWSALDDVENLVEPDDLRAALDADPKASAFFETLDANNRYAVLHRLQDAKKPETRARRIEKFVAMLSRGETIHRPRRAR
jgi:uncharacterized protein YdeI (YjbR/CyaY-like superfamily)